MKKKTIQKTIQSKIEDWLLTLPEELSSYVRSKVVVTGGSIASMFLREPVNDYDVYFKNIKAVIMVAQHYCEVWEKEHGEQNKSENVVASVKPTLRLTLSSAESDLKSVDAFLKNVLEEDDGYEVSINHNNERRVVVSHNSPALKQILDSGYHIIKRAEIFIKSQGFVGENPDEEYSYFESGTTDAAEEFINNTLGVSEDDGVNKYRVKFMSSNAITLSDKMQIVIRFFGEPSQIHDTYDFVHATCYWTHNEGLVTNTRALECLLSKELVYAGSKYPLASIFRTRKFIKREWNCHVGNYVKMAVQLNDMDLNDPFVLEEQLTGVDAAYLYQIIKAVKDKRKDDPDFEFNSAYICTLVDRLMGEDDNREQEGE